MAAALEYLKPDAAISQGVRVMVLVSVFALAAAAAAGTGQPSQAGLARMGLVPRPKYVRLAGQAALGQDFHIAAPQDFAPAQWLSQVLERTFGWRASAEGATAVRYVRRPLEHGAEAYRLEVADDRVTIVYSELAGAFRATGTLIRLLTSYAAQFDGQRLALPGVRVSDWPDVPLRGVHLQMAFSVNERLARDTIEAMARLGYNMVGIEIGGRFEYRSHPECAVKPFWTREQIRGLVALAKARGMTPIPCINAINHTERSPHVFVIDHKAWNHRVMDLANPRFYDVFFDLLDELVEAFERPPYVHIGTDECHAALRELVKRRGGSADRYYAEFVNRVAEHLRRRSVRTVIWHDMLLRRGEYPGEPANAFDDVPTDRALDTLDRRVLVDYWCYNPAPYKGLELLRERGFEVWVSPWYNRQGVAKLCWAGYRSGASAVLGTTWSDASRVAQGIVLTADHAWNASREGDWDEYEPWALANRLYCGRPTWTGGASARAVALSGGQALPQGVRSALAAAGVPLGRQAVLSGVRFDFSAPVCLQAGRFEKLAGPAEILDAAQRGEKTYVMTPRGLYWPVDGVNKPRGRAQTIVYVRAPGWTSTKTNRWGREWVVSGGRVIEIRVGGEVGGDSPIPEDGYVISAHGWQPPSGYAFLIENLHEGDPVSLVVARLAGGPQALAADLPPCRAVAVVMNAMTMLPTLANAPLATLAVVGRSGKRYAVKCNSSLELPGLSQPRWLYSPGRGEGWRVWPAWSSCDRREPLTLVAYEWQAPEGEAARRLEITATPMGLLHGVAVLAASAW